MPINEDIRIERANCTFDVDEFTKWYFQGEKKLEEKRFLGIVVISLLIIFNFVTIHFCFVHVRKLFSE